MPDLIATFVSDYLKANGRSDNTVSSYQKDLQAFLSYAKENAAIFDKNDDETLTNVKQENVEDYFITLEDQNYKPSSRARKLSCLRAFYSFLKSSGRIKVSPVTVLRPQFSGAPPKSLSDADVHRLNAQMQDESFSAVRDRCIVSFIADLGLKTSQVVQIEVSDVSLGDATLRLGQKTVPLPADAMVLVRRYAMRRAVVVRNSGHFFVNRSGTSLSSRSVRRNIEDYAASAGLQSVRITVLLRNRYVYGKINQGESPEQLAGHLGYASGRFAAKYKQAVVL